MIPLISIVGIKNCGKTTLVEKIVTELVKRGVKTATIKHDAHGFEIDHEGKDSFRHKQAGASSVLISSQEKYAHICDSDEDMGLDELIAITPQNVDVIITEGYKGADKQKIEIFRKGRSKKLLTVDNGLVAVATNDPENEALKVTDKPLLNLDDPAEICDFIEENIIKNAEYPDVILVVDGKSIPLNDFVAKNIASTVESYIVSLNDCDDPDQITLKICLGKKRK